MIPPTFVILLMLVLAWNNMQAQDPIDPPYGGTYSTSRFDLSQPKRIYALDFPRFMQWGSQNFDNHVFFGNAHFMEGAGYNATHFPLRVYLDKAVFFGPVFFISTLFGDTTFVGKFDVVFDSAQFHDQANFVDATFYNNMKCIGCQFLGSETSFAWSEFWREAVFTRAHFRGMADFRNIRFHSTSTFQNVQFDSTIQLTGSTFANVSFQGTLFGQRTQLDSTIFSKGGNFSTAQFRGRTSFNKAYFVDFVDFSHTFFATIPTFEATKFASKVDFSFAQCEKGLDLRTANLDSATAIYLEGLQVQNGDFFVRWDQLNYRNGYRLQVKVDSSVKNEYIKLEAIYYKLRDNFLAQNNQASADDVMHELAERRYIFDSDKNFWKWSYGFFLGYGYVPWRFLLYIVLPSIVIFAVFWYAFYGEIVLEVLQKNEERTQAVKGSLKSMPFIVKMWYMIYFSSSVLFGIHFRKDWIHHQKPSFVFWITVQWLFGIALFVVFAVCVTNSHLQYVGGVLGL